MLRTRSDNPMVRASTETFCNTIIEIPTILWVKPLRTKITRTWGQATWNECGICFSVLKGLIPFNGKMCRKHLLYLTLIRASIGPTRQKPELPGYDMYHARTSPIRTPHGAMYVRVDSRTAAPSHLAGGNTAPGIFSSFGLYTWVHIRLRFI